MKVTFKNWNFREDGRIRIYDGSKVIFSCHYRNLKEREQLQNEFNRIIGESK